MGAEQALALLSGESEGVAAAMTWLPTPALRALTWSSGLEGEPEALEAVASAFGLDLAFVSSGVEWAAEGVARLRSADIAAGWIVPGPFGRVAESLGWSTALRMTTARPGELAYALDEALQSVLDGVRAGIDADAQVVLLADELAGAAGWLVPPDYALEALVPLYRRVAIESESAGLHCVFHSDGDVRALMPALRSCGFDGIHFGSPGAAGTAPAVAAARAAGLCPLGGIETVELTTEGARAAGEHARSLASGGALVLADDGGITTAEEAIAFGAALDAARTGGRGAGASE